jgi:hypothetical protein
VDPDLVRSGTKIRSGSRLVVPDQAQDPDPRRDQTFFTLTLYYYCKLIFKMVDTSTSHTYFVAKVKMLKKSCCNPITHI